MHPPLYRPHPKCGDLVANLVACHEQYAWGKFMGACNDEKADMDKCFRAEKEEMRYANQEKGRAFDQRFENRMALIKEMKKEESMALTEKSEKSNP
mmetsp:Transcript_32314/g.30819  ORF Transcript_32314/g.30819 Transcript_32314/m.30819 type:complete len:96 (+) Transcript_32314:236-523(+)